MHVAIISLIFSQLTNKVIEYDQKIENLLESKESLEADITIAMQGREESVSLSLILIEITLYLGRQKKGTRIIKTIKGKV